MRAVLGLFPLNAVLMPGAALRLQIFEDRYKAMISQCIEQKLPFGVLLDRSGNEIGDDLDPVDVGTVAIIRRVTKLASGRLHILATGLRRFKVERVIETVPFWRAEISYLDEEEGPAHSAARLRSTAVKRLKDYLEVLLAVSDDQLEDIDLPLDAAASSYIIADALQVDLVTKQQLLEAESAAQRLQAEIGLLDRETSRLRSLRESATDEGRPKTPFVARFSLN